MPKPKPPVIHRGKPREGKPAWFTYRGRKYLITGGGPGTPNALDGYEIHTEDLRQSQDGFFTMDDIREFLDLAQKEGWETLFDTPHTHYTDPSLIWKQGFDAGQRSAYIGHYDQYDRGSLMFESATNPYDDAVVPERN